MLSVIIPNNQEATVIHATLDNLHKELVGLPGGHEILLVDNWVYGVMQAKGNYICLVDADGLVSSSYFSSNMGLFKKQGFYRKLAMITSCVGVKNWGNRVYGYRLGRPEESVSSWRVVPERQKRSNGLYPIQIGFIPGAIIRRSVFDEQFMKTLKRLQHDPPVILSTRLSFYLWDTGHRILVNPNTTYASTNGQLEQLPRFNPKVPDNAAATFAREDI